MIIRMKNLYYFEQNTKKITQNFTWKYICLKMKYEIKRMKSEMNYWKFKMFDILNTYGTINTNMVLKTFRK